jgi:peptidyl-prolyl cis-trans isomerase SurA
MKRFVAGVMLVGLALSSPVATMAQAPSKGVIVERVIVRVNGEIFTQTELTQRQVETLQDKNLGALTEQRLKQELEAITPQILVAVVDDLLLVQRGREMGVKLTDQWFNGVLETIKKQNNLTDARLKEELAAQGLTMEQLRQNLERAELRRAVQQRELMPSMTITQEEQRQYYATHKAQFMTPETVTLRQLLLMVPARPGGDASQPDPVAEAAGRARITALRERAVAGEDFTQLVRDHSDMEAIAKANGGLVGPVKIDEINPVLKEAILGLKPGGISEPIRTTSGYQILKLETRTIPEQRSFDSVRSEIEQILRNERLEPEQVRLLERLRTQAVIEWKDDTYKKMYETARAEQTGEPIPGDPGPSAPASPPAPAPPSAPSASR